MSEPTKEAIEDMYAALQIAVGDGWAVLPGCKDYMLTPAEILRLIAHVRKKARDDALERAKAALNDERVDGTVSPEDTAYNTAIDHCIEALDAMKDKPDGEV